MNASHLVRRNLFALANSSMEAHILAELAVLGDGDPGRGLDALLYASRGDPAGAAAKGAGILPREIIRARLENSFSSLFLQLKAKPTELEDLAELADASFRFARSGRLGPILEVP